MHKILTRVAAAALAVAALAGCADGTAPATAPVVRAAPAPLLDVLPGLLAAVVPALVRDDAIEAGVTTTRLIGSAGGTLALPGAGLVVTVPQGAITQATRITVTAVEGRIVAYDFQPHGIRFARPLTLTQDLVGTTSLLGVDALLMRGAYYKDAAQLDQASGFALVDEILPARVDLLRQRVSFDVTHFSGYMIATGRSR